MSIARTVLVVDDSPSMRQMVSHVLVQSGYQVVEGANGREALAQLEAAAIDLVITDLNMPVLDGIALIREIRSRPASKFTPVLMLTTEWQPAKKAEGRAAGASGWLVKPFNPKQLLQVVAKVLQ